MNFRNIIVSAAERFSSGTGIAEVQHQLDTMFNSCPYPTLQREIIALLEEGVNLTHNEATVTSSLLQKACQRDAFAIGSNVEFSQELLQKVYSICLNGGREGEMNPSLKSLSNTGAFLWKNMFAGCTSRPAMEPLASGLSLFIEETFSAPPRTRFIVLGDLLDVFSNQLTTTVSLTMPQMKHEECRIMVTQHPNLLRKIFEFCVVTLTREQTDDVDSLLGLLYRCLTWNYSVSLSSTASESRASTLNEINSSTDFELFVPEIVSLPDASWVQELTPRLIDVLCGYVSHSSAKAADVIVQLAGVQVCGSSSPDFLTIILEKVSCLVTPTSGVFIMHTYCHVLYRCVVAHGVLFLLSNVPFFSQHAIGILVNVTCSLFVCAPNSPSALQQYGDQETFVDAHQDALCSAVGVWGTIVQTICTNPSHRAQYYDAVMQPIASTIFASFVRCVPTEWKTTPGVLPSIAILGRENPVECVNELGRELSSKLNEITGKHHTAKKGQELCALVELCGHVLADDFDGEVPGIPSTFTSLGVKLLGFEDGNNAPPDAHVVIAFLINACNFLLSFRCDRTPLSPDVLLAFVKFFTRISATYASPNPDNQCDDITLFQHQYFQECLCNTVVVLVKWGLSVSVDMFSKPVCDLLHVFQSKESLHPILSSHEWFPQIVLQCDEDSTLLFALLGVMPGESILPTLIHTTSDTRLAMEVLSKLCICSQSHYNVFLPFLLQNEDVLFQTPTSLKEAIRTVSIMVNIADSASQFVSFFVTTPFDRMSKCFALPCDVSLDNTEYHELIREYCKFCASLHMLCGYVDKGSLDATVLLSAYHRCFFEVLCHHVMKTTKDRYEYLLLHTPEIQLAMVTICGNYVEEYGFPQDPTYNEPLKHILLEVGLQSSVRDVPCVSFNALQCLVENGNPREQHGFLDICLRCVVHQSMSYPNRDVTMSLATMLLSLIDKLGLELYHATVVAELEGMHPYIRETALGIHGSIAEVYNMSANNGSMTRRAFHLAAGAVESKLLALNLLRIL
eukprot:PhF_6_TR16933/c0_g1_i1/m.25477